MKDCSKVGFEIGEKFVGPMIFSYVSYVLDSAIEKNVKRLYFMARDGYLMYKCALRLQENNEKYACLELSYFYASRLSLRLPQYYISSIDEILDSLFVKEYKRNLGKIFSRLKMTKKEISCIINKIGVQESELTQSLDNEKIAFFKKKLSLCEEFKKIVFEKSEKAYKEIGLYLDYEKMVKADKFAIVDSGWVGSMQESLLALLKSFGFKGRIIGYYFGMYKKRENTFESEYNTYYFKGKGDVLKKAYFNNNMFEILCSANDGMTVGYEKKDNGEVKPVLAEYTYCKEKAEVQQGALEEIRLVSREELFRLLKNLMHRPKEEYVQYLKAISFSDSLSDSDALSLAREISGREAIRFLLPVYVANMLKGQFRVFWEEGSIYNSCLAFKKFLCFNVLIVKILRYMLKG